MGIIVDLTPVSDGPHSGAGNGADIYTKAVGKQLFDTLAPGETGYSDGPLPRAVISLTPMEARKFGADISSD